MKKQRLRSETMCPGHTASKCLNWALSIQFSPAAEPGLLATVLPRPPPLKLTNPEHLYMDTVYRGPCPLLRGLGVGVGAGRGALIPMNIYPSLLCEGHDPEAWAGTPEGSGGCSKALPPPHLPELPFSGLRTWRRGRALHCA